MKKILILCLVIIITLIVFIPGKRAVAEAPVDNDIPVVLDLTKGEIVEYAYDNVVEKFGKEEWDSFDEIIKRESGWNSEAQNPKSTAYGYGQFLDSTWKSTGIEKTTDPEKQIDATIIYISQRYGTPSKALSYHDIKNHY